MKKLLFAFLFFPFCVYGQIITTIAGNATGGYTGDGGAATVAELNQPQGVTIDGSGNVYIADIGNNVIRKVNTSGIINTIAGNGTAGYSGDGGPATAAELSSPECIALDGSGNMYIADFENNVIRKVNTAGIISTIAGNGSTGYSGDGGPATAAELSQPGFVTIDGSGNMLIADVNNDVIRKVNTSGIISTVAGMVPGGYSGDGGPATAAQLNGPTNIAVDSNGNMYITDLGNHVIRKVTASGIISTIAGNGTQGYSGDGGPATSATLYYPWGIAVDGSGNVYFSDDHNYRVRKVNTSGIISTVAGNGTQGYSGDDGAATAAELNYLAGITIDSAGNLYIADAGNSRIRKVSSGGLGIANISGIVEISVFPNPATSGITIQSTGEISEVVIMDLSGQEVYRHECSAKEVNVHVADLPTGMYLLRVNGMNVQKFLRE